MDEDGMIWWAGQKNTVVLPIVHLQRCSFWCLLTIDCRKVWPQRVVHLLSSGTWTCSVWHIEYQWISWLSPRTTLGNHDIWRGIGHMALIQIQFINSTDYMIGPREPPRKVRRRWPSRLRTCWRAPGTKPPLPPRRWWAAKMMVEMGWNGCVNVVIHGNTM